MIGYKGGLMYGRRCSMRWRLQWFRTCSALVVCFVWLAASCAGRDWRPVPQNNNCNPSNQDEITSTPQWANTLGKADGEVEGCLRISWTDDDIRKSKAFLVRLKPDGKILSYAKAKGQFQEELSFALPSEAQGKPRAFRIFVFTQSLNNASPTAQDTFCQENAQAPGYSCLANPKDCWFAIAFKPATSDPSALSPIPEAPNASCFIVKQPVSPAETGVTETVPDAAEPPKETPPEQPKETPAPDKESCVNGAKRTCYPNATKGCVENKDEATGYKCELPCRPGQQTCSNNSWGSCDSPVIPTDEVCNGVDDDCNGQVDDGLGGCNPACATETCVDTVAGQSQAGFIEGKPDVSLLNSPLAITADPAGIIYIADAMNHAIRRLDPVTNILSNIAGTGTKGSTNIPTNQAKFSFPSGITADAFGNIYISDTENHTIRKIDINGNITRYAGRVGQTGLDNGALLSATFNTPEGLAVDKSGKKLYVVDRKNNCIRVIDTSLGRVDTFTATRATPGADDGIKSVARFNEPTDIKVGPDDNLYVADTDNHKIRKIGPTGTVSTFLGDGTGGFKDGDALNSNFNKPKSIAFDANGNLYIADTFNHRIRFYDKTKKTVSTVAGIANFGHKDGPAKSAAFDEPSGIIVGKNGNVYVCDKSNNRIRVLRVK